jgi:hypothetical protein
LDAVDEAAEAVDKTVVGVIVIVVVGAVTPAT